MFYVLKESASASPCRRLLLFAHFSWGLLRDYEKINSTVHLTDFLGEEWREKPRAEQSSA